MALSTLYIIYFSGDLLNKAATIWLWLQLGGVVYSGCATLHHLDNNTEKEEKPLSICWAAFFSCHCDWHSCFRVM